MFVIVYKESVILGPMRWNRFRFENEIQEECGVSVVLPNRNDELEAISVDDDIKILPVQGTPDPTFNSKIEMLNGPLWQFTDTHAIMSYRVMSLPIDAVKSQLKEKASSERWNKENSGVNITLNGVEYKFRTDKETRAILQNASSNLDSINWKQDADTWLQLSNQDVKGILTQVLQHVQSCFDWEFAKFQEIDACVTHKELDAIVITEAQNGYPDRI